MPDSSVKYNNANKAWIMNAVKICSDQSEYVEEYNNDMSGLILETKNGNIDINSSNGRTNFNNDVSFNQSISINKLYLTDNSNNNNTNNNNNNIVGNINLDGNIELTGNLTLLGGTLSDTTRRVTTSEVLSENYRINELEVTQSDNTANQIKIEKYNNIGDLRLVFY